MLIPIMGIKGRVMSDYLTEIVMFFDFLYFFIGVSIYFSN